MRRNFSNNESLNGLYFQFNDMLVDIAGNVYRFGKGV
jgi:hypothetical protein